MRINDLLSDKILVDKDEAISNALEKMEKHNIRDIPVTNDSRYIGSLSYRDLAKELGSSKKGNKPSSRLHISTAYQKDGSLLKKGTSLSSAANELVSRNNTISLVQDEDKKIIGSIKAIDILKNIKTKGNLNNALKKDFEFVSPSDRVVNSRRRLLERGSDLLIIRGDTKKLGIVTNREIAQGMASFRKHVPDEKQDSRIRNLIVEDIMESNFLEVDESQNFGTVIDKLTSKNNHICLVSNKEEIIGYITQLSILKSLFGDERE